MGTRTSLAADRYALAVVWLGMVAFVALHSFLFLEAVAEQTRSLVRTAWFAGLGLVAVVTVYFTLRDRSTADEA